MTCPQALDYLKQIVESLNPALRNRKGSLAAQYLEYDRGGFKTRPIIRNVTVTTAAPLKLLSEAVDRWSWTAINISVNGGYFAFGVNPSATNGIYVMPNGGNSGLSLKEDGMLTEQEVWAVNLIADGVWYVVEEILI